MVVRRNPPTDADKKDEQETPLLFQRSSIRTCCQSFKVILVVSFVTAIFLVAFSCRKDTTALTTSLFGPSPLPSESYHSLCCGNETGDKTIGALLPFLPPGLEIHGRDDFINTAVDNILNPGPAFKKYIPIKGGPGMGKSTIATGIVHDPRIVEHFGSARHWVYCGEASDIPGDQRVSKLLDYISESFGLDLTTSSDRRKHIKHFLGNNNAPRIIVLDNFETMWEPEKAREAAEGVLKLLIHFPQLTVVITTRNAHDPATNLGVSWHRYDPIQPLSLNTSRILFSSLSPQISIDNRLDDLLQAIDCIPLAIILMASSAQEKYTTSEILETWNKRLAERANNHNDTGDPITKLDRSISMSLQGPLVKSQLGAPVLLRIMAELPGGIRTENIKGVAPLIANLDQVVAVLIRASLLSKSPDFLQMHSTIRSHMLRNHHLGVSHKKKIQAFYFQLIHEAGDDPGTPDFLKNSRRLFDEKTNAETLLLDALDDDTIPPSVFETSIDFFNFLIWTASSVHIAEKTAELLRNRTSIDEKLTRQKVTWIDLLVGFFTRFWGCVASKDNSRATATQTGSDTARDSLLARVLLRLGTLYFRIDEYDEARETLWEALNRFEQLDHSLLAAQALYQLAELNRHLSNHTNALQLYSKAHDRFQDAGNASGMASSLRGKAIILFEARRFAMAVALIEAAQKSCRPDDRRCTADCQRELGRVLRERDPAESIRQLTKARRYYLDYGPQRHASMALYQKAVALYSQGDFDEAEMAYQDAYGEFRTLGNESQMGYCIYYLAKMYHKRGRPHWDRALELYRQSENMFAYLESNRMIGLSLRGQAELYARLCEAEKAKTAYNSAYAFLAKANAREAIATMTDSLNIQDMCGHLLCT